MSKPKKARRSMRQARSSILARARNYLLTGLVVAAPIGITVYLTWSFVTYVDEQVKPLIPASYNPETYLPFSVPGMGLVLSVLFLIGLGWVTAKTFGKTLLGYGERLVDRMPVIRTIYNALKQIVETIASQQETSFQKVGLIEYPRPGLWAIVFITAETQGEIPAKAGAETMSVFLPTTPNPTSGYLLFVPKSDVIILDMTVEQAAKLVISGGLVNPTVKPAPVPKKLMTNKPARPGSPGVKPAPSVSPTGEGGPTRPAGTSRAAS